MKNFGDYLRQVRKGKMTQRELASKIGVGYPYISKIENNIESPPSDKVLIKLAEALGIDTDEVYIKARKIPEDIKYILLKKPELIKTLRSIKEDDISKFLLDHFEDLIRHKEVVFWQVFDKSDKKMLLIDPDTFEIVKANNAASEFYGYSTEELSEMKIIDINILSKEEILEEINKAILKSKNKFNFKHRFKSGKIVEIEVASSPIVIGEKIYLNSVINEK